METLNEIVDFLILYFRMRNLQNWEFVGYKNVKALMIYITGIRDTDTLRRLFDRMVKQGYFEKRKIKSNTDYRFIVNPS